MLTPRVEYVVTSGNAIDLHVDGYRARQAVSPVPSRLAVRQMAAMLGAAVALGEVHGRRDFTKEIAATLQGSFTPGVAVFTMRPDHAIVVLFDGEEHQLAVRPVKPRYAWHEFRGELSSAFELGGKYRRKQVRVAA